MKKQYSKKDWDLQLKQCILVNFRCYLIAASAIHEMRPLCYAKMKAHWYMIMQPTFKVVTAIGFVAILISFSFWGWSVTFRSVFCDSLIGHIFGTKRFKGMVLYHFWSTHNVLSANAKIFQIFRSWIFADCQNDDTVKYFWDPGVKSEIPSMFFKL